MNSILAISCSTEHASVACLHQGEVSKAHNHQPRQHSEMILDLVKQSLNDLTLEQIDCIAVDCGPGSFMGIRTAVATAQGLAFAHNIAVYSISSLQLLALSVIINNPNPHEKSILSAVDARRGEWYFNRWSIQPSHEYVNSPLSQQRLQAMGDPIVASPQQCLSLYSRQAHNNHHNKANDTILTGNVWHDGTFEHPIVNASRPDESRYPDASHLAHIADHNQPFWHHSDYLQPIYVRDQVAHMVK